MHESRQHLAPRFESEWAGWGRTTFTLLVTAVLLYLGAANIRARATWGEVEDGVLWSTRAEGVIAAELAPGGPAARAGVRVGDLLLAIDGRPVDRTEDVVQALHAGVRGSRIEYTVVRAGERTAITTLLEPIPQGNRPLYFVLAVVGIFTLLVGAGVRLRRPGDQATLHFFWLAVAWFGTFTFSFSGRLDQLDWVFYWGDLTARLAAPALFLHFALVFPDRPNAWIKGVVGRRVWPLMYVPAVALGALSILTVAGILASGPGMTRLLDTTDRLESIYLAFGFVAGLVVLVRALTRVRSVTARRQLRWIVWGAALGAAPFALGYALPYGLGLEPSAPFELLAAPLGLVPLSFASAIVRYRLMDVEVIIKRGLVYTAAVGAIAAIYALLLQAAEALFLRQTDDHSTIIAVLATLVVVLLAGPVKNAIQNTLDRAFYRDRYDYRRALVGFARDLNSDLDLYRLSDRLVSRVTETMQVERMAMLLASRAESPASQFTPIRAIGFDPDAPMPPIPRTSGVGIRLEGGETVALDDPAIARRFSRDEVERWRDHGVAYFLPCVSKEGVIAVMALGRKDSGEPLNSEDLALLQAVAGQAATAIENGRLYGQLSLKADELDRMREFSENIVESLSDGLVAVDLENRVARWNHAMERLYGVAASEAVGRSIDELFDAGFVGALRAALRESPNGALLHRTPLKVRRPAQASGSPDAALLVNAAASPLRATGGATSGTIVILEDVTSRVRLEEQLQISEKMASIGLLAAGVAHEVNTPLTGISSFTQMLLDGADPNDPKTSLLEKIERQTFRAAKIVNGLLNLSRPAKGESAAIDLNVVVNDVLSLVEHQFSASSIKVRKELSPQPVVVVAVEHKLQQVFLNLFLNARDAMPSGGWLSIATRAQGDTIVAEVSDTGSGIPAEQLSRIYDPFFTTKEIGQGTGLGLSITYGIVHEHGGVIDCQSNVGQGTRFIISFPRASAAPGDATSAQSQKSAAASAARTS